MSNKTKAEALAKAARWLDNMNGNVCALGKFVALGYIEDEIHRYACEMQCKADLAHYTRMPQKLRDEVKWLISYFKQYRVYEYRTWLWKRFFGSSS